MFCIVFGNYCISVCQDPLTGKQNHVRFEHREYEKIQWQEQKYEKQQKQKWFIVTSKPTKITMIRDEIVLPSIAFVFFFAVKNLVVFWASSARCVCFSLSTFCDMCLCVFLFYLIEKVKLVYISFFLIFHLKSWIVYSVSELGPPSSVFQLGPVILSSLPKVDKVGKMFSRYSFYFLKSYLIQILSLPTVDKVGKICFFLSEILVIC